MSKQKKFKLFLQITEQIKKQILSVVKTVKNILVIITSDTKIAWMDFFEETNFFSN